VSKPQAILQVSYTGYSPREWSSASRRFRCVKRIPKKISIFRRIIKRQELLGVYKCSSGLKQGTSVDMPHHSIPPNKYTTRSICAFEIAYLFSKRNSFVALVRNASTNVVGSN